MNTDNSYVNDYTPPTSNTSASAVTQPVSQASTAPSAPASEKLEDQNIFTLLGVSDGSDSEKSQFLDQLQQVIWEDFLENDVTLLVLDSEYQKLKEITGENTADLSIETQEKVIEYLEELIPDLEDIMVDKAVRLKADLVRERIQSLKTLHSADSEKSAKILEAESLIHDDKWASGSSVLNTLS